jgi:hypothetical protein
MPMCPINAPESVRLELDAKTLARLLDTGQLHGTEFRCLDCDSKRCVWRLFLMSCAKNMMPGESQANSCKQCGACRGAVPTEPGAPPQRGYTVKFQQRQRLTQPRSGSIVAKSDNP